ncbi:MAG: hypothetical protein IJ583_02500 [Firmicutes bacterium]|nr:hypothetical protein [Bacillota bacterium]
MKFFKQIVTAAFMISVSASMLNILQAAENKAVMRINDPIMEVNGEKNEIDPGIGTTPIISDGHTLVPIRAMIESFGGNVEWNAQTRTATLTHGKNNIKLVIGSKNAYINGEEMTLDTVPVVVKGRTMLPLRFVSEGFGFDVEWDNNTKTITVTQNDINTADTEKVTVENTEPNADKNVEQEKNTAPNNNILVVYFTRADNIKISDDIDAVSSASLNKTDGKLKGNTQIAAEYIHEKVGGDIINL